MVELISANAETFVSFMNFQGLKTVGNADFYLDVAIKRTKKYMEELREGSLRGTPLQRSKFMELSKLESVETELNNQLTKVLKSFPSLDNLSEFYKELIAVTLDYPYIKRSLAAIKWCNGKNREFLRLYKDKIKLATEITRINQYRREFYGRVASTLKQINKHLEYLEHTRRTMLSYPSIKTSLTTIAIAGFPNVGKSTLLSKLTPAKPKIANYAFTTQGVNIGYGEFNGEKIQFMDIPGTLNRFEKQNIIEQIATLAVKYVAEAVIYVFDLTETAYSLEDQITLYNELKKSRKPIIIYLSKTDILEEEKIVDFKKKFRTAMDNIDDLKEEIKKVKVI